MAKIKVRYLTKRKRADGSMRHFWQPDKNLKAKGWKLKRLSDDEMAAISEAQAINESVDQWRLGELKAATTEKRGTVSWLINHYKNSRDFKEKSSNTQDDYGYYLSLINAWAGDQPAAAITKNDVQILYDAHREKYERKAAYIIQVLRLLFSHAERYSLIPPNSNPATKPKIKFKSKKGKLWTPENITAFVQAADIDPEDFAIGTATIINAWAGQRRGDILSLTMDAYADGGFFIIQSKTGAEVNLPIDLIPDVKARIDAQIKRNKAKKITSNHLIQHLNGLPYTSDNFQKRFSLIRQRAIALDPTLDGMVFKDLRHTAVTRLAEAGCTIPEIASITGHSLKGAEHIVDRYNIRTSKMARGAIKKRLEAERK